MNETEARKYIRRIGGHWGKYQKINGYKIEYSKENIDSFVKTSKIIKGMIKIK